MSVKVTSGTVVSPLWSGAAADKSCPPATVPVHEDGLFLSFQLSGERSSGSRIGSTIDGLDDVTFVAFHPVDETCFVFGIASGKAYGVSLQDNRLFLLADLGRGALRCGTFCPGYLTSPIVVLATATNRLVFVDWQRGVVVQEVAGTAHTQPIVCLVTGPSTEPLFCALSADAFSCWEPLASNATTASASHANRLTTPADLTSATQVTPSAKDAGAAAAAPAHEDGSINASPTGPRYTCTGSAVPTQCTRDATLSRAPVHRTGEKVAHRFLGVHVVEPTLLLSVESNNVLSLWTRRQEHSTTIPSDSYPEGSRDGDSLHATSPLQLVNSVAAPSTLRVRCSAQCGQVIALGADAVATSKQGPVVEPVVAFVNAHTLAGTGVVRLPSGGSMGGGPATKGGDSILERTTPTVVQVSALHSDLVACLLSTGTVHVVLSSTYHLVFSLQPPGVAVDASSSPASPPRARWAFTPSGPTFGAMYRSHTLALLHLPTARKGAVATSRSAVDVGVSSPLQRRADSQTQRRQSNARPPSRQIPSQEAAAPLSTLTFAHPFLRHSHSSKASAALSCAAGAEFSSLQAPGKAEAELRAALRSLSTARAPPHVPQKGFPDRWVNVNLVDMRFSDVDGIQGGEDPFPNGDEATSALSAASHAPSEQTAWSEAKFCDTLPAVSCRYNFELLSAHLLKYGVFPHAYRPLIWRFLVGLPTKAKTASQFAALARRPRHVAVEQLMRPFPLPENKTRQAVENALSCLCWASPVLTLAYYLPVFVYPLAMLYRDDVQTVVELALLFFANWGREFFVCHPRGPTSVLAVMERELARLDATLCQHLSAVGAAVEVWGWELMTTFYTDVLTGAEWLQVMDHALSTSPVWLFAFHVTLVRTRLRTPLMAAVSADEVRRVLSHSASLQTMARSPQLKSVLEDAYRLYSEWARGTESSSSCSATAELALYMQLRTLTPQFEYPSDILPHDPVLLAEKMRELALVQRRQKEEAEAVMRYAALRQEADTTAAQEAAFVQQQRARVAAKYDASATAWQVQVALERVRQEQEAQERQLRWEVLQQRTRNAEELTALRAEMNTVESQLRHDMVDRHMEQLKWGLATHMTDEELARLQQAAEEQVEQAVRYIDDTAQAQASLLARFHDEPALQVNVNDASDVEEVFAASSPDETAVEEGDEQMPPSQGGARSSADGHEPKKHPSAAETMSKEENEAAAADVNGGEEVVIPVDRCEDTNGAVTSQRPNKPLVSSHNTTMASSSSSSHHTAMVMKAPIRNDLPEEHEVGDSASRDAAELPSTNCAIDPAVDATTLSADTRTYVSPWRDGQSTRQHHPSPTTRLHGPSPARHAFRGRAASSSTTTTTKTTSCSANENSSVSTISNPTLQSFVELRDRVLRRLQPTNSNNDVQRNSDLSKKRPSAGLGRCIDTTGTDTCTFSSASYYTSDTYESRVPTGTSASQATSSTGHRLFDDDVPHRGGVKHAAPRVSPPSPWAERQRLQPWQQQQHHSTRAATTASTTAITSATSGKATSTQRSSGYDTSCSYSSYYDYSTGRSGNPTSTTGSFPRTTTTTDSHSTF